MGRNWGSEAGVEELEAGAGVGACEKDLASLCWKSGAGKEELAARAGGGV